MHATPSTAEPAKTPDQTGGSAVAPEAITRFLFLLRWIVGYGKTLADTFHQRAADADFRAFVTTRFHTSDLNAIFARIRRGLMLAAGLEAKLAQRAAAGRDLTPAPDRPYTPRRPGSGSKRKRTAVRHTNIVDLPLDRLPTAEQIADELRRRPAGAVLADICRDLGILPGDLPPGLCEELFRTIPIYGGNILVLLFKDMRDRLRAMMAAERRSDTAAQPSAKPARNTAASPTGPPTVATAA